jgi:hypothetical protein
MWHFRTTLDTNQRPTPIQNMVPADRDTGVAVDVILMWQGGVDPEGGPITYIAILDTIPGFTSPAAQVDSLLFTRQFDPPLDLSTSTTYFWRVTARDSAGAQAESGILRFTTRSSGGSGGNLPPDEPRVPVPTDGATEVPVTIPDLTWSGGNDPDQDPVIYSVYFGTVNPPPLVVATSLKRYGISSPLAEDTIYFWRVEASDDHAHVTAGPLWRFTTGANDPPAPVTSPIPPDGAQNVAVDIELQWQGGDDPEGQMVTYDVYFAVAGEPLVKIRETSNRSAPPAGVGGTLSYLTAYNWRIDARDPDSLVTSSPLWSFTTVANLPPSTPAYLSPADGATDVPIETSLVWSRATDPEGGPILYHVYLGRIGEPLSLVASAPDTTYTPPSGLAYSSSYRWRIVAEDSEQYQVPGPTWVFSTVEGNAPSAPCGPTTPVDGATGTAQSLILSWGCGIDPDGDPVTFTVRLDTANPPVNVLASGLTTPSASVSNLLIHTQYFWQVEATDGNEPPVAGPVWSFTTLNRPPGTVANPVPANGAIDVSIDADLGWTGGSDPDGDPVTFHVYLDMVDPPVTLIGSTSSRTIDPGTFSYSTTFYWQVRADDGFGGVTAGPVWSFTSEAPPNNPPSAPSNPSPADGATEVAVTANLSWSGGIDPDGDPVTFDVYFGTTNPPPLVGNQAAASYDPPGDLNYSADYYWQIVAKDDRGGETPGPVWSFSTEGLPNNPPSVPSNPNPANGATGVDPAVILSWSGGIDPDGDPVTFDVYFGTSDPPGFASNQPIASYDPPGDLAPSTIHYWRIVAKDDRGGETSGGTWFFTTAP